MNFRRLSPPAPGDTANPGVLICRLVAARGYYLTVGFIAAFFAWFIFSLVSHADWILSDDAQLLRTVLSGRFWTHDGNWPQGRFNPLYYLELDPLAYIGNRPDLVFIWVAIKALATAYCLVRLLRHIVETSTSGSRLVAFGRAPIESLLVPVFFGLFWLSPGIYQVFSVTIYPEQTLIPLLALFVLAYAKFPATKNVSWAVAALLSANASCYLKEPAFLIFSVVALTGILNRRKDNSILQWLDSTLFLSAGLFLALYYFLVFRGATQFYHQARGVEKSYFDVARIIYSQHPLLVVLTAAFGLRMISFFRGGFFSFYDSISAAALCYSFAFVVLRLDASYYITPAYILIIPALFSYTLCGLSSLQHQARLGVLLLGAILLCYIPMPRVLYGEILKVRYARQHDWEFVDNLLPYRTYFLVPESEPNGNRFEPALDEWRRITLETFLDFRRHGRYTGEPVLPAITRLDDVALTASARVMVLTPTRHAASVVTRAADFRFVSSYFGLESYAFPSLKPGSDVSALAQEFFEEGWSGYERSIDARWTDAPTARLRIFVGSLNGPVRFSLKAHAFIPGKQRLVRVAIGSRPPQVWRFEDPDTFEEHSLDLLPEDAVKGFINIAFHMDDAATPKDLGLSKTDSRKLGLLCRSFRLDEIASARPPQ